MVLLTSQEFVKAYTNIDDNLQMSYLAPAIRESQDIDLQGILGNKLTKKLEYLVSSSTIDDEGNEHYKELLDKCQYFLAYNSIVKVILICSVKISNFGASQAEDDKIKSLSLNDIMKLQAMYQDKADYYCRLLQNYILDNTSYFPELFENDCNQTKSNLYSAASTGIFLGGARGKRLPRTKHIKDCDC